MNCDVAGCAEPGKYPYCWWVTKFSSRGIFHLCLKHSNEWFIQHDKHLHLKDFLNGYLSDKISPQEKQTASSN